MSDPENFGEVDFKSEKVIILDRSVSPSLCHLEQLEEFQEDILYIEYNTGQYGIDIGWYPAFSIEGQYTIALIEDNRWDKPLKS
ncbi:hypothetical protein [Deinococcus alpinitundrae]|uniref:hypothetical protein n=1 Tax=Deinococcus alpinitundrae TaxID=468913 RepID=UPI00137ABC04|nr:hypothetical protein [Deinococcus alpinitundrae]